MLLALVLAQALVPASVDGPIFNAPAVMSRTPPAYFEFAPASGVGMTAVGVCGSSAPLPTGRLGEALTFTRASVAWATLGTNGLRAASIADGDLVQCATGKPRVMYDADGVKGLLVEGARTNALLRSQELDNAAVWVPTNSGAAGPTTTNGATAPDGSSTAEVVSVPAVSAGQHSYLGQSFTASAAPWTASIYLRGDTTSGTVYLFFRNGSTYHSTPCNYVSTSGMRCVLENKTLTAATWEVGLGVDLRDGTQSAQSAQAVRAWGAMAEVVSAVSMQQSVSSYIATSSAAVGRSVETATFAVSSTGGDGCVAMSWDMPRIPHTNSVAVAVKSGASNYTYLGGSGGVGGTSNAAVLYVNSLNEASGPAGITSGLHRIAGWWTAADSLVTVDGVAGVHGNGAVHVAGSTVSLAQGAAGGIISRVQYDPNPSRCR